MPTFVELGLRDLVEAVAVGVIEDIGEMPEQRAGLLELEKRRVVAAALERIGAHHPARRRGLVEAAREEIVVEVVRHELVLRDRAAAPLGVMIVAARPDRRRIGHLLDQERAARLLVSSPAMSRLRPQCTPRVRTESSARKLRVCAISRPKSIVIVRFGSNGLVLHEHAEHARHLAQIAHAGRIVVRARLLHVRAEDVALRRARRCRAPRRRASARPTETSWTSRAHAHADRAASRARREARRGRRARCGMPHARFALSCATEPN